MNLDNIADDVTTAMGKPNPQIKQQMDNFIFRQLVKYGRAEHPKKFVKTVIPVLLKHAEDGDKDVRESSLLALGGIMRIVGEDILKSLAGGIMGDSLKMTKINEGKEKAEEENKVYQSRVPESVPFQSSNNSEAAVSDSGAVPTLSNDEPDPWDFLDPVDVLKKLPQNFFETLGSSKWLERKEALENLSKLLTENPKLDPQVSYTELSKKLSQIISKDSNINVVAAAGKVVAGLAKGLRANFSPYSSALVPAILDKFKEKKSVVKDALVEAIDEIYKTTTLESISEEICGALVKPNPNIKIQTSFFLSRVFKGLNADNFPKKILKDLFPLILKNSGDSDAETRESSFSAIGSLMKAIGKNVVTGMLGDVVNDKTKMSQIEKFFEEAVQNSDGALISEVAKQNGKGSNGTAAVKPILSRREAPKTQVSSLNKDVNKNIEKKPVNVSSNARPPTGTRPVSSARPPTGTRPSTDVRPSNVRPTLNARPPSARPPSSARSLSGSRPLSNSTQSSAVRPKIQSSNGTAASDTPRRSVPASKPMNSTTDAKKFPQAMMKNGVNQTPRETVQTSIPKPNGTTDSRRSLIPPRPVSSALNTGASDGTANGRRSLIPPRPVSSNLARVTSSESLKSDTVQGSKVQTSIPRLSGGMTMMGSKLPIPGRKE